jgi:hypothetical protein
VGGGPPILDPDLRSQPLRGCTPVRAVVKVLFILAPFMI